MEKEKLIIPAKDTYNRVKGFIEWDYCDADYVTAQVNMNAEDFFKDDTLLLVLAFVATPYDYMNAGWNESSFGHHVFKEDYIWFDYEYDEEEDLTKSTNPICVFLREKKIVAESGGEAPHSVHRVNLEYIDENGKVFNINFDSLRENWKKMTYGELLESINKKCLKYLKIIE